MKKILILSIAITLSGCIVKSGTHIRTGEMMPKTTSQQVKLYSQPPKNYRTLGLVSGKASYAFVSEQTRMDAAIERMRKEAAALGANGILLQSAGSIAANTGVGQIIGNTVITSKANDAVVSGTAIYVIEE